jgi:voltage-gated potassium channel Kch
VLVVGFGPTGQAVADALDARGMDVQVIDLNPHLLAEARRHGYRTQLGDATYPEVLEHVAVADAAAVAVTLPDPAAVLSVVEQARALAPGARVFARARYHVHGPAVRRVGAHGVVDEEEQVGRALAEALLEELELPQRALSSTSPSDSSSESS